MSNLVIVALPSKDDYVNKISSEKVAHMTLLFLGDDASKVKNLSLILDFVKHASETSLMRFGMEVDHRGELGPDLADVLFFSKNKWSGFETVRDYRSYLLKNDNIRAAYESAQQFPEWDPHLTLGYPDTPAKPDERDYPGINYVDFDRIAVWFGDYEGIEFPLKKYDWNLDVIMDNVSDGEVFVEDILDELFVEDLLSHHGILGMKWGRRSSRSVGSSRSERRAAKKVAKQDKIFSKKSTSLNTKIAMNNAVAGAMEHKQLPRINNKAVYKKASADGTLNNPNSPITKQYHKEIQSAYVREINNFASGFTNASGTQKVVAKESDSDALGFKLTIVNVKHDDSSIMVVKYIKNSKGEIIGFKVEDDSLTQTSLIVEDILSHHGVLGMKWGRRSSSSGPQSVSVRDRGKKFKATGGAGHPGHKDAVAPRVSGRIAKKSGVKALSNQQLEEYNKRLNLEQNYKRLSYNDKNAGQKFVARLLGKTGQTQAEAAANQVAAHQVKKLMVKTAIVGA